MRRSKYCNPSLSFTETYEALKFQFNGFLASAIETRRKTWLTWISSCEQHRNRSSKLYHPGTSLYSWFIKAPVVFNESSTTSCRVFPFFFFSTDKRNSYCPWGRPNYTVICSSNRSTLCCLGAKILSPTLIMSTEGFFFPGVPKYYQVVVVSLKWELSG